MVKFKFKKPIKENVEEDAVPIANAAGNGGIAGIGIGPDGEPGIKKRPTMLRRKKFAGNVVFEVDSESFYKATWGKKKYKHWKSYIKDEYVHEEIRDYARRNPKKPIIVQNEMTGAMQFIRYGTEI